MKTNIENLSNLERKLNILIPIETVNDEFTNAFKYLQKNVAIKGFRKGKTPMATIRNLYSDKIKNDVAQNLVQNFYYKALKEHNVYPVGMPAIDFVEPEENKEFSFSARFEIQPEITLTQVEGLEVEKETVEVTEDMLNKNIEQILESRSSMEDVVLVRELKEKDFADINFEGFMDGAPLPNGSAMGHVLEIGSDSFIPGFETALIGMKPDEEKTISLSFPVDYHVEDLKGKPVQFKVKLNKIKQKITPVLDEAFVKGLGEDQTVDGFKNQLKADMQTGEEKRVEQDLKNALFKALAKANPFDVPETMIKEQRTALVDDFKKRMTSQGISESEFGEYQEKWDADFTETADFMVRSALLIQKIAQDNQLNATTDDVEKKLEEFAQQTGLDMSKIKSFYQQGQQSANLEFQITEDKVFRFLLEKAKIKNKVATKEA